jgi:hypothetical protein
MPTAYESSLHLQANTCARSQNAIKQLKSNGPLGGLLDRLIIVSESATVTGDAGDVSEASLKLEQPDTNLSKNDVQIYLNKNSWKET